MKRMPAFLKVPGPFPVSARGDHRRKVRTSSLAVHLSPDLTLSPRLAGSPVRLYQSHSFPVPEAPHMAVNHQWTMAHLYLQKSHVSGSTPRLLMFLSKLVFNLPQIVMILIEGAKNACLLHAPYWKCVLLTHTTRATRLLNLGSSVLCPLIRLLCVSVGSQGKKDVFQFCRLYRAKSEF